MPSTIKPHPYTPLNFSLSLRKASYLYVYYANYMYPGLICLECQLRSLFLFFI